MGTPGLQNHAEALDEGEQQHLLSSIGQSRWQNDLKRRVQHYGYRYDYKARRVDSSMSLGPLPSFLSDVARKLLDARVLSTMPDQAIVNEYLPGQGIAPHVDCVPCFDDTVSTLSLGWAYELEFSRPATNEKQVVLLEPGSVLTMQGEARYLWRHEIKKRMNDRGIPRRRRVSLTFRNVLLKAEAI